MEKQLSKNLIYSWEKQLNKNNSNKIDSTKYSKDKSDFLFFNYCFQKGSTFYKISMFTYQVKFGFGLFGFTLRFTGFLLSLSGNDAAYRWRLLLTGLLLAISARW